MIAEQSTPTTRVQGRAERRDCDELSMVCPRQELDAKVQVAVEVEVEAEVDVGRSASTRRQQPRLVAIYSYSIGPRIIYNLIRA